MHCETLEVITMLRVHRNLWSTDVIQGPGPIKEELDADLDGEEVELL
jgi:hypothetical protein